MNLNFSKLKNNNNKELKIEHQMNLLFENIFIFCFFAFCFLLNLNTEMPLRKVTNKFSNSKNMQFRMNCMKINRINKIKIKNGTSALYRI